MRKSEEWLYELCRVCLRKQTWRLNSQPRGAESDAASLHQAFGLLLRRDLAIDAHPYPRATFAIPVV